jgi:rod shape-determining protein MreD
MRMAAQVFLAYFAVLVMASVWRLGPVTSVAPDIVAIFAAYLGLTARSRVAGATLAAAIIGYLGDLLLGTPVGLQATTAALVCVFGHLIHRRMLVRGLALTVMFSLLIGAVAALVSLGLRAYFDLLGDGGMRWGAMFLTVLMTGVFGPIAFVAANALDRRFVRASHLQSAIQ